MNPRRNHGELGQGLIEFAVIFPIFIFVVFAVVDGGLTMGRYNEINHAAKEGARLGAVGATNAQIVARVKAQSQGVLDSVPAACSGSEYICVQYGDGASGGSPDPGEVGSTVKVRIKYTYDGMTPLLDQAGGIDVTACSVARMERPRQVPGGSITGDNEC